jgi:alpha-amylase
MIGMRPTLSLLSSLAVCLTLSCSSSSDNPRLDARLIDLSSRVDAGDGLTPDPDSGPGDDGAALDGATPALTVSAGDPLFVTIGTSAVLDGSATQLPAGCTTRWSAEAANPSALTFSDDSALSPRVSVAGPGVHGATLTVTCPGGVVESRRTLVIGETLPLASYPAKRFVYQLEGSGQDNTQSGAQGRRLHFVPTQYPTMSGVVTEVWVDVAGKRLQLSKLGDGSFELWVKGAAIDTDRRYWAFVGDNRYARVPVLQVRSKALSSSWELTVSAPLAASFGGTELDVALVAHPANPSTPAIKTGAGSGGDKTFTITGPLSDAHRFYLVGRTPHHRSRATLVTLPLPGVGGAASADLGVIYQVYVKHFADSDGDGIGDLQGLNNKLSYLVDLGVDTLLLMPIFQTPGDVGWGYNPADFSRPHAAYGSLADLQSLVTSAHAKGLKVLLDFPLNHVSTSFAQAAQAIADGDRPTSRWFLFDEDPKQRSWFNWDYKDDGNHSSYFAPGKAGIITVALDHPPARRALIGQLVRLLDPNQDGDPSDGVDGFRLDYAKGPSLDLWRQLGAAARAVRPDVALVGEAWTGAEQLGVYLREGGFSGVFDFPFHYALRGALERGDAGSLYWHYGVAASSYGKSGTPVAFTSNHDVGRIVADIKGKNFGLAQAALAIVLTAAGNPLMFYGDELGLLDQGGGSFDRRNGGPFLWGGSDAAQCAQPAGAALQLPPALPAQKADAFSLYTHSKALLALRRKHAPLSDRAARAYHYSEFTDKGVYAIVRQSGKQRVLVVVNLEDSFKTVSFSERKASTKLYHAGYGKDKELGPYGVHLYALP